MNQEYILTAIEDKCDSCTEICVVRNSIPLCVWSNLLPVFPFHHMLHDISLTRH